MSALNEFLVVLLVLCIIALIAVHRHKPVFTGVVIKSNIDLSNRTISYVTISTGSEKDGDVLLAFDTCAKIGCRHPWFFGRSQCFHDKGQSLLVNLPLGKRIKVQTEGKTDGAQYVHKLLKV